MWESGWMLLGAFNRTGGNFFKTYKVGKQKVETLKKMSMKIGKGQMTAVIGSSGSGKSTLLHLF